MPAGSNVIASQGVRAESGFSIKANAQAFRILSSGLYSDKISAVLREIGCNAADAHVAAGTPERPIEVKLPTAIDGSFHIKDWGTGLSHEEIAGNPERNITGLFTTYFASNKCDSNDMTGAFGLGCKSPFSYTDSFAVTSVHKGVQRAYAAHLGGDGSPIVSLLGEGPAQGDWPSGMMVSFPVKPQDVTEFHNKARQIFQWFKVAPTLLGTEPIEKPTFEIEGSNFRWVHRKDSKAPARVLMGNVAYPLDAVSLGALEAMLLALVQTGLHLEVPIGAVMPTASREALDYNPQTRAYLNEALLEVARELSRTIWAKALLASQAGWAGRQGLHAYLRSVPRYFREQHLDRLLALAPPAKANRAELAQWVGVDHCKLPKWTGDAHAVELYRNGAREHTISRKVVIAGRVRERDSMSEAILHYQESPRIIVVDAPYTRERVRTLVRSAPGVAVLTVGPKDKEPLADLEAYAGQLAQALGDIPVALASTLSAPAARHLKNGVGSQIPVEVLHATRVVNFRDFTQNTSWSPQRLELGKVPETARFYLVRNNSGRTYTSHVGKQSRSFSEYDIERLVGAYRELEAAGLPITKIDGLIELTTGQVETLGLRGSHWKSLFQAIFEAFQSDECVEAFPLHVSTAPRLSDKHEAYGVDQSGVVGALVSAARAQPAFWQAVQPLLHEHPAIKKLVDDVAEAESQSPRAKARDAIERLRVTWSAPLAKVTRMLLQPEDLPEALKRQYPLLAFIAGNRLLKVGSERPEEAVRILRVAIGGKGSLARPTGAAPVQLSLEFSLAA